MLLLRFQTKNQKKSRAQANHVAEEGYGAVPHSFVFHRGQIGKNVGQLIQDVRKVMEPYTAESLKVCSPGIVNTVYSLNRPPCYTFTIMPQRYRVSFKVCCNVDVPIMNVCVLFHARSA